MRLRARSRLEQAGFTLAEAVVSVAVSMIGLGGVMMMNAQQLKLVSSTRESNAASWALQDRVELLRNVSWGNLTNADSLKLAMSKVPDCARMLPNYTERVTLVKSTEAELASAAKLVIEQTAGGEAKTISTGSGLSTGKEVKVDVLVSWTGKGGRHRERSYTSIISDSGVTRTNVPGFGGPTGTTPVDNGGTTETPSTQPVEIVSTNGTSGDSGSTGSGDSGDSSSGSGSGTGSTGSGGSDTGSTGSTDTASTGTGNNGNGNGYGYGYGNENSGNSGNGNPHGNTNGNPGIK
jgi:Tfp pilus assembly protein PilV